MAEDRYGIYRIVTTNPSMSLVDGAVDGSDCLDYKLYRQNQEGEIALSGSLSLDTGTSFASNIYVGIEDESGEENLYYVTQRENNGDYSQFSMVFTPEDAVTSINLYLDTGDVIYAVSYTHLLEGEKDSASWRSYIDDSCHSESPGDGDLYNCHRLCEGCTRKTIRG